MKRILTVFILIFLFSCTEKTKVNLVSGTVYQDCDNVLSNSEIALKSNISGSFSEPLILGNAFTKEDGTFNFTYELEEEDLGSGDIILVKSTGFETILTGVELNENENFNIYRSDITFSLILNLKGTKVYTSSDTLFYSVTQSSEIHFVVQPMNGVLDTLSVPIVNSNVNLTENTFFYGIGSEEFIKSKVASNSQGGTFQNIFLEAQSCSQILSKDIEIN